MALTAEMMNERLLHFERQTDVRIGVNYMALDAEREKQQKLLFEVEKLREDIELHASKSSDLPKMALDIHEKFKTNAMALNYLEKISQLERSFTSLTGDFTETSVQLSHPKALASSTLAQMDLTGNVESCWSYLGHLSRLGYIHIRNAADYHQFHHTVNQLDAKLRNHRKMIQPENCRPIRDDLDFAPILANESHDHLRHFLNFWSQTDKILETSRCIHPIHLRLSEIKDGSVTHNDTNKMVLARVLHTLKGPDYELTEGEEVRIVDTTEDPHFWQVQSSRGFHKVPSVCLWLSNPDLDAVQCGIKVRERCGETWELVVEHLRERLRLFYTRLLSRFSDESEIHYHNKKLMQDFTEDLDLLYPRSDPTATNLRQSLEMFKDRLRLTEQTEGTPRSFFLREQDIIKMHSPLHRFREHEIQMKRLDIQSHLVARRMTQYLETIDADRTRLEEELNGMYSVQQDYQNQLEHLIGRVKHWSTRYKDGRKWEIRNDQDTLDIETSSAMSSRETSFRIQPMRPSNITSEVGYSVSTQKDLPFWDSPPNIIAQKTRIYPSSSDAMCQTGPRIQKVDTQPDNPVLWPGDEPIIMETYNPVQSSRPREGEDKVLGSGNWVTLEDSDLSHDELRNYGVQVPRITGGGQTRSRSYDAIAQIGSAKNSIGFQVDMGGSIRIPQIGHGALSNNVVNKKIQITTENYRPEIVSVNMASVMQHSQPPLIEDAVQRSSMGNKHFDVATHTGHRTECRTVQTKDEQLHYSEFSQPLLQKNPIIVNQNANMVAHQPIIVDSSNIEFYDTETLYEKIQVVQNQPILMSESDVIRIDDNSNTRMQHSAPPMIDAGMVMTSAVGTRLYDIGCQMSHKTDAVSIQTQDEMEPIWQDSTSEMQHSQPPPMFGNDLIVVDQQANTVYHTPIMVESLNTELYQTDMLNKKLQVVLKQPRLSHDPDLITIDDFSNVQYSKPPVMMDVKCQSGHGTKFADTQTAGDYQAKLYNKKLQISLRQVMVDTFEPIAIDNAFNVQHSQPPVQYDSLNKKMQIHFMHPESMTLNEPIILEDSVNVQHSQPPMMSQKEKHDAVCTVGHEKSTEFTQTPHDLDQMNEKLQVQSIPFGQHRTSESIYVDDGSAGIQMRDRHFEHGIQADVEKHMKYTCPVLDSEAKHSVRITSLENDRQLNVVTVAYRTSTRTHSSTILNRAVNHESDTVNVLLNIPNEMQFSAPRATIEALEIASSAGYQVMSEKPKSSDDEVDELWENDVYCQTDPESEPDRIHVTTVTHQKSSIKSLVACDRLVEHGSETNLRDGFVNIIHDQQQFGEPIEVESSSQSQVMSVRPAEIENMINYYYAQKTEEEDIWEHDVYCQTDPRSEYDLTHIATVFNNRSGKSSLVACDRLIEHDSKVSLREGSVNIIHHQQQRQQYFEPIEVENSSQSQVRSARPAEIEDILYYQQPDHGRTVSTVSFRMVKSDLKASSSSNSPELPLQHQNEIPNIEKFQQFSQAPSISIEAIEIDQSVNVQSQRPDASDMGSSFGLAVEPPRNENVLDFATQAEKNTSNKKMQADLISQSASQNRRHAEVVTDPVSFTITSYAYDTSSSGLRLPLLLENDAGFLFNSCDQKRQYETRNLHISVRISECGTQTESIEVVGDVGVSEYISPVQVESVQSAFPQHSPKTYDTSVTHTKKINGSSLRYRRPIMHDYKSQYSPITVPGLTQTPEFKTTGTPVLSSALHASSQTEWENKYVIKRLSTTFQHGDRYSTGTVRRLGPVARQVVKSRDRDVALLSSSLPSNLDSRSLMDDEESSGLIHLMTTTDVDGTRRIIHEKLNTETGQRYKSISNIGAGNELEDAEMYFNELLGIWGPAYIISRLKRSTRSLSVTEGDLDRSVSPSFDPSSRLVGIKTQYTSMGSIEQISHQHDPASVTIQASTTPKVTNDGSQYARVRRKNAAIQKGRPQMFGSVSSRNQGPQYVCSECGAHAYVDTSNNLPSIGHSHTLPIIQSTNRPTQTMTSGYDSCRRQQLPVFLTNDQFEQLNPNIEYASEYTQASWLVADDGSTSIDEEIITAPGQVHLKDQLWITSPGKLMEIQILGVRDPETDRVISACEAYYRGILQLVYYDETKNIREESIMPLVEAIVAGKVNLLPKILSESTLGEQIDSTNQTDGVDLIWTTPTELRKRYIVHAVRPEFQSNNKPGPSYNLRQAIEEGIIAHDRNAVYLNSSAFPYGEKKQITMSIREAIRRGILLVELFDIDSPLYTPHSDSILV